MTCPLCSSGKPEPVTALKTRDIIRLYKKKKMQKAVEKEFGRVENLELLHCPGCDLYFFYPLLTGSGSYYETMQTWGYYLNDKNEYKLAATYLQENDDVLEIGCGNGFFSRYIGTGHYTGLDINPRAVNECRKNGLNVIDQSIAGHAEENPERYDAVCCFQVLEHVVNPADFLRQCKTALKKGGRLIVSVPSFDSYLRYVANAILNMPPHHVTLWSDAALKNLSTILCITLEHLEHEPLQDVHIKRYAATMVKTSLSRKLLENPKLIDRSPLNAWLDAFCYLLSKPMHLGLKNKIMKPRGHTVIAVYRKKETQK